MSAFRPHIALFMANLMYGANYVVAKGLMPGHIGPNGFIFFRALGAVALFWCVYIFCFQKIDKRDIWRILVCALFGVACNQLCFFNGLMRTSPVNASVMMTLTPAIVLLLSFVFLKERIRSVQLIGLVIGGIGSIVFSLSGKAQEFSTTTGDLFILLNATAWSIYLILVKPLMAKYNPVAVMSWVFLVGLVYVTLFPLTLPEVNAVNWSNFDTGAQLRFAFVILCVTFLPYLLISYAIRYVQPYMTSIYIYLQPLFTAVFILLFAAVGLENYTSDFSLIKILSALIVFLGVYLVVRPAKAKPEVLIPQKTPSEKNPEGE